MAKTAVRRKAHDPASHLSALGLQSFEIVRVHRGELKNAPYNPRILSPAQKRKLTGIIKKHGMVAPPTWNRRTGNIVGGHQRLAAVDALAETKDYELDVAAIDVDETKEKEINVALNNPAAQGEWDIEALSGMLKDSGFDIEGAGFDHADVFQLFGDTVLFERDDPLDALAAKVRAARELYDHMVSTAARKQAEDFYAVVVFRNPEQMTKFFEDAGLPDNRFQSGEEVMRLCGFLPGSEPRGSKPVQMPKVGGKRK